jgi:hypothetical protein
MAIMITKHKKFTIGSHYVARTKDSKSKSEAKIDGVCVEIISQKTKLQRSMLITKDRVLCKIISVPNDSMEYLVGLTYPFERNSLQAIDSKGHKCNCDFYKVIMVTGCKCGGY